MSSRDHVGGYNVAKTRAARWCLWTGPGEQEGIKRFREMRSYMESRNRPVRLCETISGDEAAAGSEGVSPKSGPMIPTDWLNALAAPDADDATVATFAG